MGHGLGNLNKLALLHIVASRDPPGLDIVDSQAP